MGYAGKNSKKSTMIDIREGRYRILVQEGEVGWEFIHDEAPKAIEMKRVVSVDAMLVKFKC